jgi:hypothetical protein
MQRIRAFGSISNYRANDEIGSAGQGLARSRYPFGDKCCTVHEAVPEVGGKAITKVTAWGLSDLAAAVGISRRDCPGDSEAGVRFIWSARIQAGCNTVVERLTVLIFSFFTSGRANKSTNI